MNNQKDTVNFDDLEDLSALDDSKPAEVEKTTAERMAKRDPADSPTFKELPCPKCGGKGYVVMGYVNIQKYRCYKCAGTGRVAPSKRKPLDMSPEAIERRQKAGIKRRANKVKKAVDHNAATAEWEKSDELGIFLRSAADWSEFAVNMLNAHHKFGEFTEKQEIAIRSMKAKVDARGDREADADLSSGNLEDIFKIFTKAIESGRKRPVLRIAVLEDPNDDDSDVSGHLKISLAPAGGKNAGHLYVKLDDDYQGKIDPDGKFFAIRDAEDGIAEVLVAIADDPLAKAVLYGRKTGNCACCGRELTNQDSIDLGIGPICAEKWGF